MLLTMLVLHAMAAIATAPIPHGTPNGTPAIEQLLWAMGNAPVNPVVGDRGFVERFGRPPCPSDPEVLRVATHLAYAEHRLRSRDVSSMPADLRAERLRNLDRLHRYRLRGIFPHNYDHPGERRPCFIDRDGTICAVGYLVEQSAGRPVAEAINSRYQYAAIAEMDSPLLNAWLAHSGLTAEEAATIQPGYYTPASVWIGASGGVNVPIHSRMTPPPELSGTTGPIGTQHGFNPLASVDVLLAFPHPGFMLNEWPNAILARLSYDNRSIETDEVATGSVSLPGGGSVPMGYTMLVTHRAVTADVLWAQRIGRLPLVALAGPSMGFVLTASRRDGWVPESGLATMTESDAPFSTPRFGLKAGLQYELPARAGFVLAPYAIADIGLSAVRPGDPWRADAVQFGIELRLPTVEWLQPWD